MILACVYNDEDVKDQESCEFCMEESMKILIVEDDRVLAEEIQRFLIKWGYEARIPDSFRDVAGEITAYDPHLVLMDINLPNYDGFYWCARIREISQIPVLYISSRGDDRDKIMAMAQGGDDYMEKPFHLDLLRAKIEAMLRRAYQYQVRARVQLGEKVSFDSASGTLYCRDEEIELTRSERRIIDRLIEGRPFVVTREELMMALWSTDEYVSDGTLTTVISRLRSKLRDRCKEEIIYTKKGQGYLIK